VQGKGNGATELFFQLIGKLAFEMAVCKNKKGMNQIVTVFIPFCLVMQE